MRTTERGLKGHQIKKKKRETCNSLFSDSKRRRAESVLEQAGGRKLTPATKTHTHTHKYIHTHTDTHEMSGLGSGRASNNVSIMPILSGDAV